MFLTIYGGAEFLLKPGTQLELWVNADNNLVERRKIGLGIPLEGSAVNPLGLVAGEK